MNTHKEFIVLLWTGGLVKVKICAQLTEQYHFYHTILPISDIYSFIKNSFYRLRLFKTQSVI